MVNVDVAEPPGEGVIGLVEKDCFMPDGLPESDRDTDELNPFNDVTVIV